MNKYQFLKELMPVLSPRFYCWNDTNGNELVFLETEGEHFGEPFAVSDKTQLEALENHIHLFGRIRPENRTEAREIAIRIACNLQGALEHRFPDKQFLVFLTINPKDATIIRFHQVWDGEPPYYDADEVYRDTEVFAFKA